MSDAPLQLAVVVGSTRPGRKGRAVADWVLELARRRSDASFELLDLVDHPLPLLDEPLPPSRGQYQHAHTKAWSAAVARFDGYVFVTPEYNHGPSAALKNALDYLFNEWVDKACAFVGYGSVGGARAVEQLRLVAGELHMADVRSAVALSLQHDFEAYTTLRPQASQEKAVARMLDQLVAWAGALRPLRRARAT